VPEALTFIGRSEQKAGINQQTASPGPETLVEFIRDRLCVNAARAMRLARYAFNREHGHY
jgi:hypothetical protein